MNSKQKNGFTIIELLVIVAFVGLALSSAIVILGSLRLKGGDIQKLHDTRRLSDMNQLRTGLDLFYTNAGGYPDASIWATGQVITCSKISIFQVPIDPLSTNYYTYHTKGAAQTSKTCNGYKVWSDYTLQFRTETESGLGPAGMYCLTPSKGIVAGVCK